MSSSGSLQSMLEALKACQSVLDLALSGELTSKAHVEAVSTQVRTALSLGPGAEARLQRREAEVVALREAGLSTCELCHGSGSYFPQCPSCEDSTEDHECPGKVPCSHPNLPEIFRQPNPKQPERP